MLYFNLKSNFVRNWGQIWPWFRRDSCFSLITRIRGSIHVLESPNCTLVHQRVWKTNTTEEMATPSVNPCAAQQMAQRVYTAESVCLACRPLTYIFHSVNTFIQLYRYLVFARTQYLVDAMRPGFDPLFAKHFDWWSIQAQRRQELFCFNISYFMSSVRVPSDGLFHNGYIESGWGARSWIGSAKGLLERSNCCGGRVLLNADQIVTAFTLPHGAQIDDYQSAHTRYLAAWALVDIDTAVSEWAAKWISSWMQSRGNNPWRKLGRRVLVSRSSSRSSSRRRHGQGQDPRQAAQHRRWVHHACKSMLNPGNAVPRLDTSLHSFSSRILCCVGGLGGNHAYIQCSECSEWDVLVLDL
jgi:hypothetical protein